jgi:FkbM family methyltransferase
MPDPGVVSEGYCPVSSVFLSVSRPALLLLLITPNMSALLKLLPAPLIRAAGRLQFQMPFLSKPINYLGQLLAGSGVIQRGAGKGLRFNGRGCSPGYVAGTSELLEQSLILKHLARGGVFYDVGANAGFYAVIGARAAGPTGQVYAFEPMPTLAERIRENGRLNSMANLMVVEAAVSNSDGTVNFAAQGALSMLNSIGAAQNTAEHVCVRALRVDTFAADHRPPTLMLIDIEGDEIQALQGGLRTIATYLPVLMVEVHYLGKGFVDFYEQTLRPLGYDASTYDGQPLRQDPVRYHALLFPRERRPAL